MAKNNELTLQDLSHQITKLQQTMLDGFAETRKTMDRHYEELSGQTAELAQAVGKYFEKSDERHEETQSRLDILEKQGQSLEKQLHYTHAIALDTQRIVKKIDERHSERIEALEKQI